MSIKIKPLHDALHPFKDEGPGTQAEVVNLVLSLALAYIPAQHWKSITEAVCLTFGFVGPLKASITQALVEGMADAVQTSLALDVSTEEARAIHRVVRALNDGECPKCHLLDPQQVGPKKLSELSGDNWPDWHCERCGFTIEWGLAQKAMELFAPSMERALKVFEEWRAKQ